MRPVKDYPDDDLEFYGEKPPQDIHWGYKQMDTLTRWWRSDKPEIVDKITGVELAIRIGESDIPVYDYEARGW